MIKMDLLGYNLDQRSDYTPPEYSLDDILREFSALEEQYPEPEPEKPVPPAPKPMPIPPVYTADRERTMVYGGRRIDTAADESYTPTPQRTEYVPEPEETEEEPEAEPVSVLDKLKGLFERKPKEPPTEEDPFPEGGSFTDRDADNAHYAKKDFPAYDEDDDEDDGKGVFPGSFREYLTSLFAAAAMRVHNAKVGFKSFRESDEALGDELSGDAAYEYYKGKLDSLFRRTWCATVVTLLLIYVSLRLPLPGMLRDGRVASMLCLAMLLTVMVIALEIVTNGIMSAVRGKPRAETMAVVSCLLSGADAVLGAKTGAVMPFCAVSALSLTGLLWSSFFWCKAMRKTTLVLAKGGNLAVPMTGETKPAPDRLSLYKTHRPTVGFLHRSEECTPDESFFAKFSVPALVLSAVLALVVSLSRKSFGDFLHVFSAIFSISVPLSALSCFALPYFLTADGIFSSGCAVAGWSGVRDIGRSHDLVISDSDIFPKGTVEFGQIRLLADSDPLDIISYAGSMVSASGSELAPLFSELMRDNACAMQQIENFEFLEGGGMSGRIGGHNVLCGGMELMRLMNITLPSKYIDKYSLLLASDGALKGIFNLRYTAKKSIRTALEEVMSSARHPIFAPRDFNVTPDLIHSLFDLPTDGYDFPPYKDRFTQYAPDPASDSEIAGIVCREGLEATAKLSRSARRCYSAARVNLLVAALGAVIGMILFFVKFLVADAPLGVGFGISYTLLWALPTVLISFLSKR